MSVQKIVPGARSNARLMSLIVSPRRQRSHNSLRSTTEYTLRSLGIHAPQLRDQIVQRRIDELSAQQRSSGIAAVSRRGESNPGPPLYESGALAI